MKDIDGRYLDCDLKKIVSSSGIFRMTLLREKDNLEIVGNGVGDEFEVEMRREGRDVEKTGRECGEISNGLEIGVTKVEVVESKEVKGGIRGTGSDVKVKRRTFTDIMTTNPSTPTSHLSPNASKDSTNNSNPSIPSISASIPETKPIIPSINQFDSAKTIVKTITPKGPILITQRPRSRSSITSNTSDTSETVLTHSRISQIHDGGEKFGDQGDLRSVEVESREENESKVAWSWRMKRYRKEELAFLGLDMIFPKLSPPCLESGTPPPPPPTSLFSGITPSVNATDSDQPNQLSQQEQTPSPRAEDKLKGPCHRFVQGRRLHKAAKLSKERFEIWLNGLSSGKTSTGNSVIEPETEVAVSQNSIANGEVAGGEPEKGVLNGKGEREKEIVNNFEGWKQSWRKYEAFPESGDQRWVDEMVNSSVFENVEGIKTRDWGVQTDLTGRLIVF